MMERLRAAEVIAVDFDGVICEEAYPAIGRPQFEMIDFLVGLRELGVKLILYTCRCDQFLADAVAFCAQLGLEFDAVNANLPERIAFYDGDSRKISADIYLDDRAISVVDGFIYMPDDEVPNRGKT